ncbi:unnamed protein product [Absidia cylindrospora]
MDEIVPVNANPSDSILHLQALLAERQCLQHNSVTLDTSRTIQSYGIQNESILYLAARAQERFVIYVRVYGGRTIAINATRVDTLGAIKSRIEQEERRYPFGQQLPFYSGLLLQGDDRPMSTFQISRDTLLDLALTSTPTTSASITHMTPAVPTPNHFATPPSIMTSAPAPPHANMFAHPHAPPHDPHINTFTSAPPHTNTFTPVHPYTNTYASVPPHTNTSVSAPPRTITPASAPRVPAPARLSFATPITTAPSTKKTKGHTQKRPYSDVASLTQTKPTAPAPAPTPTPLASKNIIVKVQCHTKVINIAINTADNISVLKTKVYKHTNVASTAQSLTFNGKRLNDDETINSYKILDGALIDMLARPRRAHGKCKTTINSKSAMETPLSSSSSSSPSSSSSSSSPAPAPSTNEPILLPIKKENTKKPTTKATTDIDTLFTWKFGSNGVIDLLSSDEEEEQLSPPPPPPPLQQQQQGTTKQQRKITVRIEDGTVHTLTMDYSTESTLHDVILLYQKTYGPVPGKRKSVIFGGVVLEDEFLIDDLYLDDDSILNLL